MIEWRDVVGFDGYKISSSGEVTSTRRWYEKKLKPLLLGGYFSVRLSGTVRGESHVRLIHRLVLEAFIGPCPAGMEGCHSDGNRLNNSVENLRWDTRRANWADRRAHGRINSAKGERHGSAKLIARDVERIREMRLYGAHEVDIASVFGVSRATIGDISTNRTWASLGACGHAP